jgi:hypothetical protein
MEVITAPCKDCQKRQLHCHSSCEEYKAFKQYRDSIREQRYQRIEEIDFLRAVKRKAALINIKAQMSDKRRRR